MLILGIPAVFALVGALVYVFAAPAHVKLTEIGRILFFVGMFWAIYALLGAGTGSSALPPARLHI